MVPGSAIAITASALAIALAVSVVPSSGSSAISTARPPCPTFSPMNSMGASSRSPSPITTVPSMGRTLKAARIASTAAWSASCSLPRPIWAKAAMAAASVTRTASSAKARSSGFDLGGRTGLGHGSCSSRFKAFSDLGRSYAVSMGIMQGGPAPCRKRRWPSRRVRPRPVRFRG